MAQRIVSLDPWHESVMRLRVLLIAINSTASFSFSKSILLHNPTHTLLVQMRKPHAQASVVICSSTTPSP